MRFRINKRAEGRAYAIIVTGGMDDEGAWDILEIAQTILGMPNCKELLIDLRSALIDEQLSVLNTETLAAFFEEGLLRKDSILVVRFRDASEIRFHSGQLPLTKSLPAVDPQFTEAEFFGKIYRQQEQGSRYLIH